MPYTTAAAYAEEFNTVREDFDTFGGVQSAAVTLRCAWADRYTIVGDILGNALTWPQGVGSTAIASKASISAVPSQPSVVDGIMVYQQALIALVYSSQSPEGTSGTEQSTTNPELRFADAIEPTIEFQKLDHKQFRWASATGRLLKKDEAPGRQLRGMSFVRSIYGFTTLPASTLTLVGKVNQAAYTSDLLGLTFGVETLLFTPPSVSQQVMTDGSVKRNATIKMLYKADTWNKFWNAEAQAYQKIWDSDYNNGAGREYNNYPVADMSDWLFD